MHVGGETRAEEMTAAALGHHAFLLIKRVYTAIVQLTERGRVVKRLLHATLFILLVALVLCLPNYCMRRRSNHHSICVEALDRQIVRAVQFQVVAFSKIVILFAVFELKKRLFLVELLLLL